MTPDPDPLADASAYLATAIGSDETTLRARLGNDGYEQYRSDERRLTEIRIRQAEESTEQIRMSTRFIEARAAFWWAMAVAVGVAAGTGLGWSIVEWVR